MSNRIDELESELRDAQLVIACLVGEAGGRAEISEELLTRTDACGLVSTAKNGGLVLTLPERLRSTVGKIVTAT